MFIRNKNKTKVQANYFAQKRTFCAVIFTFLLVACWMVFSIYHRIQNAKLIPRELPRTQLFEPDSGAPYSMSMRKDKLLVFFSPFCSFCEQYAHDIVNTQNMLEDIQILFISTEIPEYILEFSFSHPSDKIVYLCDETSLFSKELKVKRYPTTFLYNGKSQKLTKQFAGVVPIGQILQEFNNGKKTR
jgi:thioredoxin-related protein